MERFPQDTQAFLDPSLLTNGVNMEKAQTVPGGQLIPNQHVQVQTTEDSAQQLAFNRPAIFKTTPGKSKRQRSNSDELSKSSEDEMLELLLIAPPDDSKRVISRLLSRFGPEDVNSILEYLRGAVRLSSPSFAGHTTSSFGGSSSSMDTLKSTQTLKVSHNQQPVLEPTAFDMIQEYSDSMDPHNILNRYSAADVFPQRGFPVATDFYPTSDSIQGSITPPTSSPLAYANITQLNLNNPFKYQASNLGWDQKHDSIFSTSSYNSTSSIFSASSNRSSTSTMASQPSFTTRRPPNRTMSASYGSATLAKPSSVSSKAVRSSSATRKSSNAKFACSQDGCIITFTRDEDRVRHEQDIHDPNGKYTCLLDTCSSFCPSNCQNEHHISPFQPSRRDKMKAHLKAHGWNISSTKIPPCWRGQYRHHKRGWSCNTCGQELGNWLDNEEFIKQHFESHGMDKDSEMQIDEVLGGISGRVSEDIDVLEKRLSQTSIEGPKHSILEFNDMPTTQRHTELLSDEEFEFHASVIQSQMKGG